MSSLELGIVLLLDQADLNTLPHGVDARQRKVEEQADQRHRDAEETWVISLKTVV